MKISKITILLICAFLLHTTAQAQGKYFEVQYNLYNINRTKDKKTSANAQDFTNNFLAGIGLAKSPQTNKNGHIILNYPGKTKKQLHDAVIDYVKSNSGFVLKDDDSVGRLHYRSFAIIGTKDKCMADLIGLTVWGVGAEDGAIYIGWSRNDIYSTIFGAQLQITKFDEVTSVNDVPFNQYLLVQPTEAISTGRAVWSPKIPLSLAYPESIFDAQGNIVNAVNKKIIENFYDGYITDLKNYLDKKWK